MEWEEETGYQSYDYCSSTGGRLWGRGLGHSQRKWSEVARTTSEWSGFPMKHLNFLQGAYNVIEEATPRHKVTETVYT